MTIRDEDTVLGFRDSEDSKNKKLPFLIAVAVIVVVVGAVFFLFGDQIKMFNTHRLLKTDTYWYDYPSVYDENEDYNSKYTLQFDDDYFTLKLIRRNENYEEYVDYTAVFYYEVVGPNKVRVTNPEGETYDVVIRFGSVFIGDYMTTEIGDFIDSNRTGFWIESDY